MLQNIQDIITQADMMGSGSVWLCLPLCKLTGLNASFAARIIDHMLRCINRPNHENVVAHK